MKLALPKDLSVDVTWVESDDVEAPVVVIWPAFGTPATFYRHLTPALRDHGITSLVVEYPERERRDGIGRHTRYGYEDLATQVHSAVMTQVRQRHPHSRIVLLGHSLGGHVALFASAHAQRVGDLEAQPDGIVLAASASPYWRGYGWVGFPRAFVGTTLMSLLARAVGYWPGDRLKFWGRQSRVLVSDWSRIARTGRVRPAGASVDYDEALANFEGDILAISLPDDAFAPVAALEMMLGKTPKARVTRWHSPTRLDHIQWVRQHEAILPIIVEWVKGAPATR